MSQAYIVTNPMIAANRSAEVTLSKFLRVIQPCYDKLVVIGGNLMVEPDLKDVELISFDISRKKSKIRRLADLISVQRKMSAYMKRTICESDQVFFWIADKMFLPFRMARKKGAEINYFVMGNVSKEGTKRITTRLSSMIIQYMASHADFLCMESRSVIKEWPSLCEKNTRIIHLYTENMVMNPFDGRVHCLGMLCRLAEGKHVLESIEAMTSIHELYPDWEMEIIGSGKQQLECESLIASLTAENYIRLLGWVDHEALVEKTKKWMYLIFPTDTEGMPNGLVEMMGRGVPALASPVGGINDIIVDGVNGFVINDNSTKTIMDGIRRLIVLDDKSYRKCSEEAYNTISPEYSLEGAIKNARVVLGR